MDYGGHGSKVWSNLVVTKSGGRGTCMDLGPFLPGFGDRYYNNTCVLPGDSGETGAVGWISGCQPNETEMHGNKYFCTHGNCTLKCGGTAYPIGGPGLAEKDMEVGSTAAATPSDEELVAWAKAWLI